LIEVIVGATAVGGGDFTVVVLVESVLDVESVTIVSAKETEQAVIIKIATSIFLIFFFLLWFNNENHEDMTKIIPSYLCSKSK
jgi:hypothetical protein